MSCAVQNHTKRVHGFTKDDGDSVPHASTMLRSRTSASSRSTRRRGEAMRPEPRRPGRKEPDVAVDSLRNPKNPSTIGDSSNWRQNPSRTPHNVAKEIDQAEQG